MQNTQNSAVKEIKTLADVRAVGIPFHHSALAWGYVTRKARGDKDIPALPYKGRFGKGFIVAEPYPVSQRYYRKCYYIVH